MDRRLSDYHRIKRASVNTDRFLTIPAEETTPPAEAPWTCRADCWPTAGTSTVALAKADANPTDLYRRKTSGEIAESDNKTLMLGRPLGRSDEDLGDVARLRSVGCRAGAAPELRRGRFNRKGEARMRFARFDGRGDRGAGTCCPASFLWVPRRRGTGTTPRQI